MNAPELDAAALRRLARGLLFDADAAGDVVQEAWLAALRRDSHTAPAEGWLAGAVKRIALGRRRAESRRRVHESLAARPDLSRAAEDVPERLEVLRTLIAALERLDDPYRAAVVMRYLDDLPPREIARRTGVPVDTARTHVRRGLELLRADLDGPRGPGREALLGAFLPLVGSVPLGAPPVPVPASTWSVPLAGGLAVKKIVVTVAAVLAVSAVAWVGLREPVKPAAKFAEAEPTLALAAEAAMADEQTRPEALTENEVGREAVVLNPEATWRLRGRLTVGDHEPLPNGRILARVHRGAGLDGEVTAEQRLVADGAGLFTWEIEAPTTLVTVAFQSQLADALCMTSWCTYAPGDLHDEPFRVWVYPLDVELRGRVLGPDGEPLHGARVSRTFLESGGVTESGADGRYVLSTSSAWYETRLTISADGLRPAHLPFSAPRGGGVMELPDVRLETDHVVTGRVADEAGAALSGVQVSRGSSFSEVVESASDGSFTIGGIDPAWTDYVLFARLEGRVVNMTRVSAGTEPVEIVLPRGSIVTGRVMDEAGAPLAYAQIRVECLFQPMPPGLDVRGGKDGRFSIPRVPPGVQHLWIDASGHGTRRLEVKLPPEATTLDVGDVEIEPGRTLRGRLVDAKDAPVAWGLVWVEVERESFGPGDLTNRHAYCDELGRFSFAGLRDGPIVVGAMVHGYAQLEKRERVFPAGELVLRMEPSGGVAGRVIDADSGEPVKRFRVKVDADWNAPQAQRLRFGPSWGEGCWLEDPEGEWVLEDDLPADRWVQVEISAEGYAPARIERAVTAVSPDPASCTVALARESLVRGLVVDPEGLPVPGALVARDGTSESGNATTDAIGRFELRGLPTGETRLAVAAEGFARHVDGPFDLGGQPLMRRIELDRGARLSGRLIGDDGKPLAGERIQLEAYEGNDLTASRQIDSDVEGLFAFKCLAPGVFDLQWLRTSDGQTSAAHSRVVEVRALEHVEADLGAWGSAALRGSVRGALALPSGTRIRLSLMAAPDPKRLYRYGGGSIAKAARTIHVEEGSFHFRGVEPGSWILMGTAQPEGMSFQSGSVMPIELGSGETGEVELVLRGG